VRNASAVYGSDLVVDLLQAFDVPYVSLNPGASFRGLHDSLVNYSGGRPGMLLCPHEEIAVGLAHGYAKASGRMMSVALHDVVGLLHTCMSIYYAYLDRAPMLILGATGPMDASRRRPRLDWIHTAVVQGNAVRDYVKWDDQPFSAAAVPGSFARAVRVARSAPQGPVYLCFDMAFLDDPLAEPLALPDPRGCRPPAPPGPDPAALEELVRRLGAARRPAVLVEYGGTPVWDPLVRLAERFGCPVVDTGARLSFPNRHPLARDARVLEEADAVLALDAPDLSPVPRGASILAVGYVDANVRGWSQHHQAFREVDLAVYADPAATVAALAERLPQREPWAPPAPPDPAVEPPGRPIPTSRLAAALWEVARRHDWVLTANRLNGWAGRLWDFDRPHRNPGRSLGTATQVSISLGVALAHRGSGRLVVDIQPDGDLMFDLGALWAASHNRIPLLMVMYNNRSYYNDHVHQEHVARMRGRPVERASVGIAIEAPYPDFATVARGLGCHAEGPVEDEADLPAALERAVAAVRAGRPALVDVVTAHR
jgi:acetolactate synthase-1/2/3 large subunit